MHMDTCIQRSQQLDTKKARSKQQNRYFEALKSVSFDFIQKRNYLHTN